MTAPSLRRLGRDRHVQAVGDDRPKQSFTGAADLTAPFTGKSHGPTKVQVWSADREGVTVMSAETGPLGGLPPADRTLLVDPPLELAIVEIRFTGTGEDLPAPVALQARARLGELGFDFARLEQARQGRVTLELNPGSQPNTHLQELSQGWQLVTADGRLHVTFMPGAVVVQTSLYERWSVSLRPVLEAVLTVVREVIAPDLVQRIGLRYVDRFVESSAQAAADWKDRIHDSLLGPACHPQMGALVLQAQQQVELRLDDTHGALLRHGAFQDAAANNAVSYLLDIDVFDLEPQEFDVTLLAERTEVLNRTAAALFQLALTSDYLRTLQRRESDAAAAVEVSS